MVPRRPLSAVSLPLSLAAALAVASAGCSGLDPGVEYPDDLPSDLDRYLVTPENDPDPSFAIGQFKIAPSACEGIDVKPVTQPLTQDDLTRFLEQRGAAIVPKKARTNLYWFDVPSGEEGSFLRLRLAVLEDGPGAAADLRNALHEHGPGWWGVRRSNLAVLAPKTSLDEALAFALKYKLVCWGMFTVAQNDDAYVVPGPYTEL